ncbi:UDP-N-acetylmuramoyl-tripeptide--D-alanyl-D-alanine ligase [Paenibacillus harenae]|uniref:UDP-N-acetylmuramoyl-tripeptide--D-alanyl-D- alanine ligase n=1 Tax=Paenibacillus harenae TaxID=306543 RepID=UPI002794386B|nr:UDP-N-acetylmuramoyl-tripeptide--D-alanyl-D-alanine ligase [Paenibacillus harenae]MDQ0059400.1 UDP-N-acetylmuramoyl-tripeptide--D-alanyl-D-alanine ligase [Paenibacillus harenae]
MIRRTIEQIAQMAGARYAGSSKDMMIHGVTKDSRLPSAGKLYVPIIGEKFDGHDFAVQAVENGAVASLWKKGHEVPEALANIPLLVVGDTLVALQRLAAAYRSELPVRVVGITGSNGKTTTKDMTAAILGTTYHVHKTEGNLNNEIGLPMTVLEFEEEIEAAVLEMGMSGFGEIDLLTKIAQPDAAIITNVGDAHMQQLGSREGIAKAKLEITAGLGDTSVLFFNGDEPLLKAELDDMTLPEGLLCRTFGLGSRNEWSAADIELEPEASTFTVMYNGEPSEMQHIRIPVPGVHNVSNALAAIAVGRLFGVPAASIAEGLRSMKLTGMRIQPVRAFNGAIMLNDAYNANPTAARAAIDLIAELDGFRRKWVVLGDMLELGPDENRFHYDLGAYITPEKADAVLTFGPLSEHTSAGARTQFAKSGAEASVIHFEEKEKLAQWLADELAPEDIVLVKGSRGMRMEQIVQALETR